MGVSGGAARLLFACVAENNTKWFDQAFNLALSIRSTGKTLAEAPIVVNFVASCREEFRRRLETMGVTIRVVEPWPARHPFSNKLRMLELDRESDFDILIMLDCDVLVVDDIASWLDATAIGVVPALYSSLREGEWRFLYRTLGVELPARDCIMLATGRKTYPYFNSGVVFVPRLMMAPLLREWSVFLQRFQTVRHRVPGAHHENQMSLALALAHARLPRHRLPPSLNFPTNRILPSALAGTDSPRVLHYHREMDERGFILRSPNESLNPTLHAFNLQRATATSVPYSDLSRSVSEPPRAPKSRIARWRSSPLAWRVRRFGPVAALRKRLRQRGRS